MVQMKNILFPTDFSNASLGALQNASLLARSFGANLLIAHVQSQSTGDPLQEQELRDRLEEVVPADSEVPYQHWLLTGDPAAEIIDLARRKRVDLIVMATHGRTGLMHLLMGSVAEAVHRQARCPVFSYKEPHEVAQPAQFDQ